MLRAQAIALLFVAALEWDEAMTELMIQTTQRISNDEAFGEALKRKIEAEFDLSRAVRDAKPFFPD